MATRLICWMFVLAVLLPGTANAELVGYWAFDEGQGDIAKDGSGNGNDGVIVNATWEIGKLGSALGFDGTSAYVEVPDHESLHLWERYTFAAWIYQVESRSSRIIDKIGAGTANGPHLDTHPGTRLRTCSGACISTAADYSLDEWHHAAITFDVGDVKLYLDGSLAGAGSAPSPLAGNNLPLRIAADSARQNLFFGLIDDVQVYNVALTEAEILIAMDGIGAGELAGDPSPGDAVTDVLRDVVLEWAPGEFAVTHDVYFGTTFGDVNDAAAANPLGALASQGQDATTFDPGRLEFGQTYFWRVDEVNGAPDFTLFGGDIWSFTVEPTAYPIPTITATASSSFGVSGPERTIDGSGLVDDLHGVSAGDMWISGGVPATIEYAFDRAYKLHELWIWNSNQLIEAFVGFGAKDVVIEHSLDGENWTVLDGVGPLAQATGTEGYAHNNTIDFGGATAQHVRLTINSVQGIAPQASLSEVRFLYVPTFATRPNPVSGATDVSPDVHLAWGRDGREAGSHDVYVGTDANNLSLAGNVSASSFDTLAVDLQLSQTYHWRVDEVNDAMDPSIWTGDVWSFTTADVIVIDDMESYRDAEFLEIWATWIDGFGDEANNGALVGANPGTGDFSPESTIVHAGKQS
ncbi:MAG: hypothetical protein IH892_15775, partial [Planctomycetes bacterium]|nr:hypothetical protein [Planctomycetota bacterium]